MFYVTLFLVNTLFELINHFNGLFIVLFYSMEIFSGAGAGAGVEAGAGAGAGAAKHAKSQAQAGQGSIKVTGGAYC